MLQSNIYHLELALQGKFDFIRKTNPWGSDEKKEDVWVHESVGNEGVAKKLQAWAIAMNSRGRPERKEPSKKEGIILPEGMSMEEVLALAGKR